MKIFKTLHPIVALAYFVGLAVCMFVFQSTLYLFLAVAGLLAAAFFFAGKHETIKTLKWLLPMSILIAAAGPFFNHRGQTVLFYLWGNSFTLEAVLLGINQAMLLAGLVLLFISFNRVIEPSEFLFLTGKHMPRTALLLSLAMQAGARLKKRAEDILEVERTKESGTLGKKEHALLLLNAFTVRSLEEGMETALVLKARDYATGRRTHYRKYLFKKRDGLAFTALAAIFICAFAFAQVRIFLFVLLFLFPILTEIFFQAKGFINEHR